MTVYTVVIEKGYSEAKTINRIEGWEETRLWVEVYLAPLPKHTYLASVYRRGTLSHPDGSDSSVLLATYQRAKWKFTREGKEEEIMANKVFHHVFEENRYLMEDIYIYLKSYQREDALEKFLRSRPRPCWVRTTNDANSYVGLQYAGDKTVLCQHWNGREITKAYMLVRKFRTAGEISGWDEERIKKLSAGWNNGTDERINTAIAWTAKEMLFDLEGRFLDEIKNFERYIRFYEEHKDDVVF